MTQQTPYIGSKISLISKLDIRYEGILYTVDSKESTIALSKVRSFGTEDRNAAHVVPPQDEVYDYIIFKANDIKDLIVCETPKPPAPGLPYDPAILSVSQGEKPPTPAPAVDTERTGSKPQNRNTYNNQEKPSTPAEGSRNNQNNRDQNNRTGPRNNQNNRDYNNRDQNNRTGPRNNQNNRDYNNRDQNNRNGPRNNQNNRDYNNRAQNNRTGSRNNQNNRDYNNRGGNGNNRPHGPRNNLKFENDYDFEKAYEQFKETLEAIVGDVQNIKLDDSHDNDAGSVKSGDDNETFYDKNKSFFDSISCEALEKEEGKNTRPDWRKERLTNQETFGQQSVRSFGYRRGGGYNNRGGGGYNNRGNGGYNNHGNGGYNNRGGYGGGNRQHGGNYEYSTQYQSRR